jgi:hypothetical protein
MMGDKQITHHFVGDDCPGGHLDEANCEDFCQEECGWPGLFTECDY